jgi:hypothetical protein
MSTRSGFPRIFIPIVIPPTNSSTAISFNNFTSIPAGIYIVSFSYCIDPITVGANITAVYWTISASGLNGTLPLEHILQLHDSAGSRADINANGSIANIVVIPDDNTLISFSIAATTSAGQYQTSTSASDANYTKVSFVRIS